MAGSHIASHEDNFLAFSQQQKCWYHSRGPFVHIQSAEEPNEPQCPCRRAFYQVAELRQKALLACSATH